MTLDELWFLADRASQRAEQAYHRLDERYDGFTEQARTDRVSRPRFRTLAERIRDTGAPYGAHTLVHRPTGERRSRGELLLVRHEGVDLWVLPGGELDDGESFREAARRELDEEAGVDAAYDGLATVTRVRVRHARYETWGVLPVFAARAESDDPSASTPSVSDPDGEISAARWFPFDDLPADTRDRDGILAWRAETTG